MITKACLIVRSVSYTITGDNIIDFITVSPVRAGPYAITMTGQQEHYLSEEEIQAMMWRYTKHGLAHTLQ